jgi:hypothetical protein
LSPFSSREDGTCIVSIKDPGSFNLDPSISIDHVDYNLLERDIVLFMLAHGSKTNQPVSLPLVGEYCKFALGIDMKHKLFKFISDRKHLFIMPDNGRQHVFLASGASERLGIKPDKMFPKFPEILPEFHDPKSEKQPLYRGELDQIALEVHEILSKSGGMLPVADIEQEMKTTKAAVINATGVDEKEWHLGSITYKYPHIFRRINQSLALVEYVKPASHLQVMHNALNHDGSISGDSQKNNSHDFPPL